MDEEQPAASTSNGVESEAADAVAGLKAENAELQSKYRSLVGKLTTMRNTLGDKLKQDAVGFDSVYEVYHAVLKTCTKDELDRRAQEISELRTANASLSFTSDTLRAELEGLNDDNAKLTAELSSLRSRASNETFESEVTLREALQDVEQLRTRLDVLEMALAKERVAKEAAEADAASLARDLNAAHAELVKGQQELRQEQTSNANLSSVLEEFQAAKDKELQTALQDLREELHAAVRSLSDHKKRAADAETQLKSLAFDTDRSSQLERDNKEKSLLIGKLRHEAVVLNEHLTEALKRLRNSSNDTSVDRRLVTNVLLTFLTTPRSDSKRFEMLALLATVLAWSDEEREKAGLQRTSAGSNSLSPPAKSSGTRPRGHSRTKGLAETDAALGENESFSNLFVEFLLRESSAPGPTTSLTVASPVSASSSTLPPLTLGNLPRIPSSGSSVSGGLFSPTGSTTRPPGPSSTAPSTRRPSFSSMSAVSSTGPSSIAGSFTKAPP